MPTCTNEQNNDDAMEKSEHQGYSQTMSKDTSAVFHPASMRFVHKKKQTNHVFCAYIDRLTPWPYAGECDQLLNKNAMTDLSAITPVMSSPQLSMTA